MFFRMVYKSGQIFLPFCHNARVWRTDRRTDRRTEFSSLYRVCITCSAVIKRTKDQQIIDWSGDYLHVRNGILSAFCTEKRRVWKFPKQEIMCSGHVTGGRNCMLRTFCRKSHLLGVLWSEIVY